MLKLKEINDVSLFTMVQLFVGFCEGFIITHHLEIISALVGSLTIGTTFFLSPIAGILTDKFGIQITTFVGGAIAFVGLLLSSILTDKVTKRMLESLSTVESLFRNQKCHRFSCLSGGTALFNVRRYVRAWRESRLHPEPGDIGPLLQKVPGPGERHRHSRKFNIHDAATVPDGIPATAFRPGRNAEEPGRPHSHHHGLCGSFQADPT